MYRVWTVHLCHKKSCEDPNTLFISNQIAFLLLKTLCSCSIKHTSTPNTSLFIMLKLICCKHCKGRHAEYKSLWECNLIQYLSRQLYLKLADISSVFIFWHLSAINNCSTRHYVFRFSVCPIVLNKINHECLEEMSQTWHKLSAGLMDQLIKMWFWIDVHVWLDCRGI